MKDGEQNNKPQPVTRRSRDLVTIKYLITCIKKFLMLRAQVIK